MTSTNFAKETINSENYQKSRATTDVLLLEGGDEILLENGTDSILLEIIEMYSTNFTKGTFNSTNYT